LLVVLLSGGWSSSEQPSDEATVRILRDYLADKGQPEYQCDARGPLIGKLTGFPGEFLFDRFTVTEIRIVKRAEIEPDRIRTLPVRCQIGENVCAKHRRAIAGAGARVDVMAFQGAIDMSIHYSPPYKIKVR
jgi:hypothetical protein